MYAWKGAELPIGKEALAAQAEAQFVSRFFLNPILLLCFYWLTDWFVAGPEPVVRLRGGGGHVAKWHGHRAARRSQEATSRGGAGGEGGRRGGGGTLEEPATEDLEPEKQVDFLRRTLGRR